MLLIGVNLKQKTINQIVFIYALAVILFVFGIFVLHNKSKHSTNAANLDESEIPVDMHIPGKADTGR